MAQHVTYKITTVAPRPGPAVVVSAGKMQKTVKVRQVKEVWNRHLRKSFYTNQHFLVNDPNSTLIEGDIITTAPERHSKHVKHTVAAIIAPFGKPIDERPPLFSAEQRQDILDSQRKAKLERRASRGIASAVREAEMRGWRIKATSIGRSSDSDGEARSEGGSPEPKPPKDTMGRSVLPGGTHRFGGKGEGGTHKETMHGANRISERFEKAKEQEAVLEKVEQQPTDEIAKERLGGKR